MLKTKPKIEAFFFDLDGTLLDTATDLLVALNFLLEKYNYQTVTLTELLPQISYGSKKIINNLLKISLSEKQLNIMRDEFIDIYRKLSHQHTQFFPGMNKVLNLLNKKNIKWGIITNKTTSLTLPIIEKFNLYQLNCQTIVCADTTPHPKPHPDPMLKACADLSVDPKNCFFIGDAKTDIEAGKAVGMRTILAGYGYVPPDINLQEWQADFIVNSLTELLLLLEQEL
jgi:2-phosphoglycolate phosphatase